MSATPKPRTYDPSDFGDLGDVFPVEPKILSVDGTVFTFPGEVSAESYRLMMKLLSVVMQASAGIDVDLDGFELTEEQSQQIEADVLGDGKQAMEDAGIHPARQQVVERTLWIWHTQGRATAVEYWRTGGQGNAQGPANREERRAQDRAKKTTPKKTSAKKTPASKS